MFWLRLCPLQGAFAGMSVYIAIHWLPPSLPQDRKQVFVACIFGSVVYLLLQCYNVQADQVVMALVHF